MLQGNVGKNIHQVIARPCLEPDRKGTLSHVHRQVSPSFPVVMHLMRHSQAVAPAYAVAASPPTPPYITTFQHKVHNVNTALCPGKCDIFRSVSPGAIVVLVGTVALVFATGITAIAALALLWSYSKLRPVEELQATVSGHRAMIDTLEHQIIRLRTQKAGAKSALKKAQAAEPEPESEEDPLLAGLSDEDKALFR